MKIGFVSDTHLDFYINNKANKTKNYIRDVLKPESGDVVIIAGDISHYNHQTKELLENLTDYYNDVLFTIGNHDLYLVSKSQQSKYNLNSFKRESELEEWANNKRNIHFLNGNSISINGLVFGGLPNWYDLPTARHIIEWNSSMNDSNLIFEDGKNHSYVNYGYYREKISTFDTQTFRKIQEEKFENLKNIDILVTHMCPCIIDEKYSHQGNHVKKSMDIFYMTDDIKRVKKTGTKYVIYGHNHTKTRWRKSGIQFLTNSIGYPSEWINNNIDHIIINKENNEK